MFVCTSALLWFKVVGRDPGPQAPQLESSRPLLTLAEGAQIHTFTQTMAQALLLLGEARCLPAMHVCMVHADRTTTGKCATQAGFPPVCTRTSSPDTYAFSWLRP
eukprot:353532-Chlamydomonas_euryale.AAC.7